MPPKEAFQRFANQTKEVVEGYQPNPRVYPTVAYAVIVEPREHPYFLYVCKNMLRFLPCDWGLIVFHGTQNEAFVKRCLEGVVEARYEALGVANLDLEAYNELMTDSKRFYDRIPGPVCLVFQTDSVLLQPLDVRRFWDYDYVGAPWPHFHNLVGNGGLSIRRLAVMKAICEEHTRPSRMPEDVFFALCLRRGGYRVAPFEVACAFSCELIPARDRLPMGCHDHIQNVQVPGWVSVYVKAFKNKLPSYVYMSTPKQDHLEEDYVQVPSQRYALVSIVSPQSNQKHSVCALKIRGVFATREDAEHHVKRLQQSDDTFDIYLVDMYKWLPIPPDNDHIENKEYQEEVLNDIIQGHKEQQLRAKQFFEERKREEMEKAASQASSSSSGAAGAAEPLETVAEDEKGKSAAL